MPGFEEAWLAVAKGPRGNASPELRPLLQSLYSRIADHPTDFAGLKEGLQNLLEFLAQKGRTNANCWAVDLFFMNCEGWEYDWGEQELPEDFHDVLARMGEALHDTVQAPEIAENFGCLPEQLLERIRRLRVDTPKV